MGISNYDISSTVGTLVSQRLVRKLCKNCAKEREFTQDEKDLITKIGEKYNVKFELEGKHTYNAVGCKECNNSGYYESKIRDKVIVTEEGIKEFEVKVSNGEEVDIKSFLNNNREDYGSKMSNLGDRLTSSLEEFVDEGAKILTDILKSLF